MRSLRSLCIKTKYRLSSWFLNYSPIYLSVCNICKAIKKWQKVHKYFMFPFIVKIDYLPLYASFAYKRMEKKLFAIYYEDSNFKYKDSGLSFEESPFIIINIFGKLRVYRLKAPIAKTNNVDDYLYDDIYYTAIEEANNDVPLIEAFRNNVWVGSDKNYITLIDNDCMLTNIGFHNIIKYLNKEEYNKYIIKNGQ